MRVLVATVRTPFIQGGAEFHAEGLLAGLRRRGHEADILSMPFAFDPPAQVRRSMAWWSAEEPDIYCGRADRVICLKFPAYRLRHPEKVLWLLHQHRSCYELWDEAGATAEDRILRGMVREADQNLVTIPPARRHAIAQTVSDRLHRATGLRATPLRHPPPLADALYSAPAEPYIWCPSRLESLKRQSLLIEAMRHVRAPVTGLIAGGGGQYAAYAALIERLGVEDRVRLLGPVDRATMLAGYAMSLGVFFGPHDEDYGYVTLEAMLAAKPVITCVDSGGPNEFVRHGETGFSVAPDPLAVAEAIDRLAENPARAAAMGRAGAAAYAAMEIGWDHVVETLMDG